MAKKKEKIKKLTKEEQKEIARKQTAEQAIPPAVTVPPPHYIADAIKKVEKARVKAPGVRRDEVIAEGADSDFWKEVKGFIEGYQKNLKENTTQAVQKGQFDLKRIGVTYLLNDQIREALEAVVEFVEFKRRTVELMKKAEIEKKKKEAKIEAKKGG